MSNIPITDRTLLIRTDFTNDSVWRRVIKVVLSPSDELVHGFEFIKLANAHLPNSSDWDLSAASVETLNDALFAGLSPEKLLRELPTEYPHAHMFVFDALSVSNGDHPVLVIDLWKKRGRMFRTIPAEVWNIDSNLSISHCEWEDFADHTDRDGIYRGIAS